MKKQLLTIIIALSSFGCLAQSFKEDPNFVKEAPNAKGYMLDTVAVSSLSKQQLYSNAMSFLTNSFKDSRSVIESKDLETGEISFSGNTGKSITVSDTTKKGKISSHLETVNLYFKCKVYLKDQKFKIIINSLEKPFTALMPGGPRLPIDIHASFQQNENEAAMDLAMGLIKSLAASLNRKPESDF